MILLMAEEFVLAVINVLSIFMKYVIYAVGRMIWFKMRIRIFGAGLMI